MKISFEGQVALVTGATRGIGKQIASDLLDLGAKVIITGTKEQDSECFKDNLDRITYLQSDFQDRNSILELCSQLEEMGKIDICINNAGINRINFINDVLENDYDDMTSVNTDAPFFITKTVSKLMKTNHYGRIVNIASIFGSISREKRSVYTMTKYALRGLTVTSSLELAKYDVLVNAVLPGFVLTDLTKKNLTEEERVTLSEQIPCKRMATPQDISNVVIFLSSKYNTYLTGQSITVDGGYVNV